MRLPLGRDEWYLCDPADRPDFAYVEFSGDDSEAFQWLSQFRGDVVMMHQLRRLFDVPWHFDDAEVFRLVASRLSRGLWLARRPAWPVLYAGQADVEAASPAFPLDERRTPAGSAPASGEPALFPDDVDFAAIAAIQQEAAELGAPFCEECERARQAAAQ